MKTNTLKQTISLLIRLVSRFFLFFLSLSLYFLYVAFHLYASSQSLHLNVYFCIHSIFISLYSYLLLLSLFLTFFVSFGFLFSNLFLFVLTFCLLLISAFLLSLSQFLVFLLSILTLLSQFLSFVHSLSILCLFHQLSVSISPPIFLPLFDSPFHLD